MAFAEIIMLFFLRSFNIPETAFALTNHENDTKLHPEFTTVSFLVDEEPKGCTKPSSCEVLPQNVTWYPFPFLLKPKIFI